MTTRHRPQPEQPTGPLPNPPTRDVYQMYGSGVSIEAARAAFERKYGYPPAFVGRVKPGDIAAGPIVDIAQSSDAGSPPAATAESGDGALASSGDDTMPGSTADTGDAPGENKTAAAPTGEGEGRLL